MNYAPLAAILLFATSAFAQADLPPPPLTSAEETPEEPPAPPTETTEAEPPPRGQPPRRAVPAEAIKPGSFSLVAPGEEATVLARGELVVGQTAHGLLQAGLFCAYAACSSTQQAAGVFLLGGLGGGLGSFLLTGGGLSGGAAQAINSGTAWGLAQGLTALAMMQGAGGSSTAAFVAATTLLGTAAGFGFAGWLHPTGGQVSMTNSGGIWLATLTALFVSPNVFSLSPQAFFGMELVAMNVGLLTMGYLSSRLEFSRGRMLLIDTGGVIGGLIGAAAFFFAALPATSGNLLGPVVGVGVAGGLIGATLLTRGVDLPSNAPPMAFAPVGPRGTPGLSFGAQF